jgi:NOL1/NOP2/fmu family ribosome biogenesis protein
MALTFSLKIVLTKNRMKNNISYDETEFTASYMGREVKISGN